MSDDTGDWFERVLEVEDGATDETKSTPLDEEESDSGAESVSMTVMTRCSCCDFGSQSRF
ncbi:hypothetical protein [Natrinema gelatinilyticum]|uniref:hypothetical protein n=1 Tax=Natrinema gelatinilyticum TaxID=2961571 RepID=UPI0020C1BC27|nr:hypothetical protein [Natrinema gelatinilyticum]